MAPRPCACTLLLPILTLPKQSWDWPHLRSASTCGWNHPTCLFTCRNMLCATLDHFSSFTTLLLQSHPTLSLLELSKRYSEIKPLGEKFLFCNFFFLWLLNMYLPSKDNSDWGIIGMWIPLPDRIQTLVGTLFFVLITMLLVSTVSFLWVIFIGTCWPSWVESLLPISFFSFKSWTLFYTYI